MSFAISPRAIAVQGIGFPLLTLAVQGLVFRGLLIGPYSKYTSIVYKVKYVDGVNI